MSQLPDDLSGQKNPKLNRPLRPPWRPRNNWGHETKRERKKKRENKDRRRLSGLRILIACMWAGVAGWNGRNGRPCRRRRSKVDVMHVETPDTVKW